MWTASDHLISGRLFLDPPLPLSPLPLPLCFPAAIMTATCGAVQDADMFPTPLAGPGGGFCVIGRKWLMSSLNEEQEILSKV